MKGLKRIAWVLGMILLVAGNVAAQNEPADDTTTELEEITVTSQKEDQSIEDVITEEDFRLTEMSGSVLDALGNQPGIQLRRNGLAGAEGNKLRLRGFGETRLRIMRDGVPMNRDGSYGNGPVDWSILSPENVESVEIYRGAGPAKFGNTLGGVVNIVTSKPDKEPKTAVSTAYGSLETWNSSLFHAWKVGRLGWTLSAGHFETDGYLRNNYLDRDHMSAELMLALPKAWELGVGFDYAKKENGNAVYNRPGNDYYDKDYPEADGRGIGGPGIGARLLNNYGWGDGSYTEDENRTVRVFVSGKIGNGDVRLDYRQWNQDCTEVYYDIADSGKKIYERETNAEDDNWSLQASGTYRMERHLLAFGGETRRYGWGDQTVPYIDESYFNGSINFLKFIKEGFKGQPDLIAYSALYAQDNWSIRPDTILEIGLRQEWYHADSIDPDAFGYDWPADTNDIDESHLDPRIALTYSPWDAGSLTARFGIAHRYPTSPEYFWWYLNNEAGLHNSGFRPEQAYQYELAYEHNFKTGANVVLRGYYYDIDDYIASTNRPGLGSVYYNIGRVTIKGMEVGLSAMLPHHLRLWTNATWQKGDKADDPWDTDNQLTNQLPDLPEKMANVGVEYSREDRFKANIWINYVDKREHFKGTEITTLGSYTLLNAAVEYCIRRTRNLGIHLRLTGQNLTDEDYEEEEGYPMPGATFIAGVRLEF